MLYYSIFFHFSQRGCSVIVQCAQIIDVYSVVFRVVRSPLKHEYCVALRPRSRRVKVFGRVVEVCKYLQDHGH